MKKLFYFPKKKMKNEKEDNEIIDFSKIFQSDYNNQEHFPEKYYKEKIKSKENLCKILKTNDEKGINENEIEINKWRLEKYGNNKIPPEEKLSIINFILECFEDQTLQVLLISAIISLVIGLIKDGIKTGWIEGSAIFFAIFIVCGISSYLNYNEQKKFQELNHENKIKNVIVVRNGIKKIINYENLMVGDILILNIGDIINVDGLFINDKNNVNNYILVDESSANGESDLIKKTEDFSIEINNNNKEIYNTPILLSGTKIIDGNGKMIVCSIGMNSFIGRNKQLLKTERTKEENLTPLKKQLTNLSNLIGNFGYISGIIIGISIILKDIITKYINNKNLIDKDSINIVINGFILSITIIVVAIPEGLPMAVAIALAYSLEKMKNEHNLVKNLNSSETMGNVNNICTDKTGTLTKGLMQVDSLFVFNQDINIKYLKQFNHLFLQNIFQNIFFNILVVEGENEKNEKILNGDMTEKALYNFLKSSGFDVNREKDIKYILPFKSENKFMVSICKNNNSDDYNIYVKGAYEIIKDFITEVRNINNEVENFDKNEQIISNKIDEYTNDSKRTIIFASKKITSEELISKELIYKEKNLLFFQEFLNNLTLELIIGIRDPIREDVPESIKKCKKAGITIRMITGDNINTALSISKDCGIITESEKEEALRIKKEISKLLSLKNQKIKNNNNNRNHLSEFNTIKSNDFESPIALEGNEFRILSGNIKKEMNPKTKKMKISLNNIELFKKTIERLKIICRATPEDKFLLVYGLKKLNNIIAVTGDGTNDAQALKQSHIGFSMGIKGTDISKEASDIILLDDSFSSIITALKYGRNVYDSIRKFIQFQLTTNLVAVFMSLLGGIILNDSPLNCIQMLWVNLIMDSFASLSLSTESPSEKLLERKPYKLNENILTKFMIWNILSQAIFQISILTFILFYGDILFHVQSDRNLSHFEWNENNGFHFTIFFNIFVFMQVFNSINARKLKKNENVFEGIFNNFYYIFVQSFIVFGQIIIVTFGGRAVRTKRLTLYQHLLCISISSLTLIFGFLVKKIMWNVDDDDNNNSVNDKQKEKKD
jgi:calcium-translocating P-type ATPase